MASSDTDQKSFKDLTEEVVNNELNEITAFQIVLKSFVESNPLTEKVSVEEVFDSSSELLSFVSVLRKHLESFTKQYGVHLVGYGCMEKMGNILCRMLIIPQIVKFTERVRYGC